jgi:hypothetical protein
VPDGLGTDLNAARAEAPASSKGGPVTLPTDATYAKGALISAVVAPGVTPYASGRVGLGAQFEAGLTYTGRAARVDLRRSFDYGEVSLSVGAGLSYLFYGDQETALPYVDVDAVQGFGTDVPVIVGWQSSARLLMVWAGVRAGFDYAAIPDVNLIQFPGTPSNPMATPPIVGTPPPSELSATRLYGGGLVGMAGGFRHFHVALELDVAYQSISGRFYSTTASVAGISMAPGGALWVDF